ncbi:N-acetylated-alpha-linked acidic dipeptidase 2 [Halocaridina rubra]|uniref:N-acetylated-alpha-linked acidic dipeptidase 2 n=1 Tax=Halocaridina rubra TaxID=373956 RepID=A0AAN8X224_HALRR
MKTSMIITISASLSLLFAIITITLVVTFSSNTGGATNYQTHLINNIDRNSIDNFLRNLTTYPHPAGSQRSKDIADMIASLWETHGLQNVNVLPYDVYISEADPDSPNFFQLLSTDGDELHTSSPFQPPVEEFPQEEEDKLISYSAYSGNGVNQTTTVYYANYGSADDFKLLEEKGFDIKGSILIIRYGKLFRGNKVRMAEERGALGVILYSDPADVAPLGPSATYPNTVYAPPGGTQLGSLVLQGDLLTQGYPAKENSYRLPEYEADKPQILVHPVGYGDAYYIISRLSGDEVGEGWQGGLNTTYRYGGMLPAGIELLLSVSNINSVKRIYNVVGSIPGTPEPDRYVLVGNHHDAWTYGGLDPSSATANILELSRIFGQMYKDGWRPRRTVVFCSWDAEETGLLGSTEYAEQFSSSLKDRAVVYLNVDAVMEGNYSFSALAVPHLSDIIYDMAKLVPNPNPEEVNKGNKYIYDTWSERYPGSDEDPEPQIGPLGGGSDFTAYMYVLGIPCLDLCFTVGPGEPGLPLYHMAYETYELNTQLMDRGLYYHEASARMWGLLALEFSRRFVLPINVEKFGLFVRTEFTKFQQDYESQLTDLNITVEIDSLSTTVDKFAEATKTFMNNVDGIDLYSDLTLRQYNDAMMLMDRSLLTPKGLPSRPLLNHVILAPSSINGYVWDAFPGLRDILREESLEQEQIRRRFLEHLTIVEYHISMAANALCFNVW